jgi:hypothetical protein
VGLITTNARTQANKFSGLNPVLMAGPSLGTEDVEVGYIADPMDGKSEFDTSGMHTPNAVRVVVRRTAEQNGTVNFMFGRLLGKKDGAVQAEATAALLNDFGGFRAPADGSNLDLLPFTLDLETWNALVNDKVGTDDWNWDPETKTINAGSDGVLEVNLYPHGTGSPGNRGTVDIGGMNNSTEDIARQVTDGVSQKDLDYHGGELRFDERGEMSLNGDTGISAGVMDELKSIRGEPKIIPIFSKVASPGDNAQYTIVCFAGVRILDVKLTGSNSTKEVTIQPCTIVSKGGISGGSSSSYFVYSPVRLVR